MSSSETFRIAVVDNERCQTRKCNLECKRMCPVVSMGKKCIDVEFGAPAAIIIEELCTGCNICTKACPFDAIQIVNLPNFLGKDCSHKYSRNSFALYRLPTPRLGQVIGLLGRNGTGKSTSISILAGKTIPNLGDFDSHIGWPSIIRHFRGSSLQDYFTSISNKKLCVSIKPQNINAFGIVLGTGSVKSKLSLLNIIDDTSIDKYSIRSLLNKDVETLSGGELQRLSIAATCCKRDAQCFMFDEPSSFLDIKQRIKACSWIRDCIKPDRYVIAIEHDLTVLDYLSDAISFFYGKPAAYGVVTSAGAPADSINTFLDGYYAKENVRFRDEAIDFHEKTLDIVEGSRLEANIPASTIILGEDTPAPFKLTINAGVIYRSEVIVLLGENGCGKTTYCYSLAKILKESETATASSSIKPQHVRFSNPSDTVRKRMIDLIPKTFNDTIWKQTVLYPLGIVRILDIPLNVLSGGEAQLVAIAIALGKLTNIYLIDEPSAALDTEARIVVSRVIRKFAAQYNRPVLVVEHDFLMASYMADRVIVFTGEPGINGIASEPLAVNDGINMFLKHLGITFRRDMSTGRPRVNRFDSQKDKEQKTSGIHWGTRVELVP